MKTTAEEGIDFDLVFLMHGTNDSGLYGGAAGWDAEDNADFLAEIKNIMDSIIEKGDDPIFVFNNAPHLMDNQKGVGRNEANDQAIRDLQKVVAHTLLNQGYNIYHYNMEKFGEENLVNEDATETCPDHSTAGEYTDEWAIHDDYFNLNTATDITEGTHPNFRGYNKMAQGIKDVVNWLLFGGSKPTDYMIDLEDVFTKDY